MATGDIAIISKGIRRTAGAALSSTWRGSWHFIRSKPLGAFGALTLIIMITLAVFAELVAKHDPLSVNVIPPNDAIFNGPGATFFFGTDNLGRDVFSRIVFGSQISLRIGFLSVILGTTAGGLLGLFSGYVLGPLDMVLQRVMDALMAFPGLILALMVAALLGRSEFNVILAIALITLPNANRVLRSQCLSIKARPYVDAAKSIGASDGRIIMRHILPNSMAPYLIIATSGLGAAILIESSLAFLGFGVPPPAPSWGGMLSGSVITFARQAWWVAVAPGLAITISVFGFNVLGDALRDVLDPRLRGAN